MATSSNTTSFQPREQLHASGKQHLHITSIRLFHCRLINFSQEMSSIHLPEDMKVKVFLLQFYVETFPFLSYEATRVFGSIQQWTLRYSWQTVTPIQFPLVSQWLKLGQFLQPTQNSTLKGSKHLLVTKNYCLYGVDWNSARSAELCKVRHLLSSSPSLATRTA